MASVFLLSLQRPVELIRAEDLYPLVAGMSTAPERLLYQRFSQQQGGKRLGCAPLIILTHIHMNDTVSGVPFSTLSSRVMVI